MKKTHLEKLLSQKLSIADIAKKIDKSSSTVRYWLKKHDLKSAFPQYNKKPEWPDSKILNSKNLEEVKERCKSIKTFSELLTYLELPRNGQYAEQLKKFLQRNNIQLPCYTKNFQPCIYEKVEKACPVCETTFTVAQGAAKEKITCSHSCANTYFRSGSDAGNFTGKNYRVLCFENHNKCCVIEGCSETQAIDVHHIDENHSNNDLENLVPLCRNHHFHWHFGTDESKLRVKEQVYKYMKRWKQKDN